MSGQDRFDDAYLKRPIILVGAGRSGSTLFARMLDAHPAVQFFGETGFLIPRLWREVWENRFWLNFPYYVMRQPTSSREPPVEIPAEELDAAKERAARGVRLLFAEIMQIDPGTGAWGFKEIWNGNPAGVQIPWSVYHAVFPHARWVHLVRHPFSFAQSSARWDQLELTNDRLKGQLKKWQQMVQWSRELDRTPHFFEIRYEDLVSDPRAVLTPILASVDLDWADACARELGRQVIASEHRQPPAKTRTLSAAEIDRIVEGVANLRSSMHSLRYEPPAQLVVARHRKSRSSERSLPPHIDLRTMKPRRSVKKTTLGKKLRALARKAIRTGWALR